MATKCVTCGGTYFPILPDGMRYFHACPPVWDDIEKRYVERSDKRDENVDEAKARARKPDTPDEDVIKKKGKGTTEVADV